MIEKIQTKIDLLNEEQNVLISKIITNGLNNKCGEKFSEIKEIGNIPKHWEVIRIRIHLYLTLSRSDFMLPSYDQKTKHLTTQGATTISM